MFVLDCEGKSLGAAGDFTLKIEKEIEREGNCVIVKVCMNMMDDCMTVVARPVVQPFLVNVPMHDVWWHACT